MGRGSSKAGSSGAGGGSGGDSGRVEQNITTQQATNARLIENMNEAQLNNEIAQAK